MFLEKLLAEFDTDISVFSIDQIALFDTYFEVIKPRISDRPFGFARRGLSRCLIYHLP